jgi:hypothetical protein
MLWKRLLGEGVSHTVSGRELGELDLELPGLWPTTRLIPALLEDSFRLADTRVAVDCSRMLGYCSTGHTFVLYKRTYQCIHISGTHRLAFAYHTTITITTATTHSISSLCLDLPPTEPSISIPHFPDVPLSAQSTMLYHTITAAPPQPPARPLMQAI